MSMKVFSEQGPSGIISLAVCNSGSQVVDCEQCGRIHFDSTSEAMGEVELNEFLQKAKDEPEKYIGHDGFVSWGNVMGKSTVADCPCNFLGYFEKVLWSHRHLISRYLIEMSKQRLKDAQETMKATSGTDIVNKT